MQPYISNPLAHGAPAYYGRNADQVALEKSKKLFKKEDEEPEEHHNTNTGGALGNEQAEKLPDIIKPPPADRSTVLEAVSKVPKHLSDQVT